MFDVELDRFNGWADLQRWISLLQVPAVDEVNSHIFRAILAVVGIRSREVANALIGRARRVTLFWPVSR